MYAKKTLCILMFWWGLSAWAGADQSTDPASIPPVSELQVGAGLNGDERSNAQAAESGLGSGAAWHEKGALPALLLLSVVAMVSISRRKNNPH